MIEDVKVTINGKEEIVPRGTTLLQLSKEYQKDYRFPIILASVNNIYKELSYVVNDPCGITFFDLNSKIGNRAHIAGLTFLLVVAVKEIFGLDANIKDCSIIVPNIAIRDEGTSYHYVKAGHEIAVNVKRFDDLLAFLKMKKINYTVGKVWSNDAIYRETVNKVKIRKEQGCICVDMECSAIAALAKFRDYEITQFFYSADNLGSENYELRSLDNEEKIDQKNTIVDLAIEFAIYLLDK